MVNFPRNGNGIPPWENGISPFSDPNKPHSELYFAVSQITEKSL